MCNLATFYVILSLVFFKTAMNTNKTGYFLLFTILFSACLTVNIFARDSDFELLAKQINNGTIEEKRDALYRIRNLNTADASRLAVPALYDSAEIVRATATHSILAIPSEEAARILLPLLKDKSAYVREETAYALGKTRSKLVTDDLILLLQKDKSDEVRGACAVASGLIADVKAFDALVKALSRKNDFIQRSAARSLGQIGDKRAIPYLERIVNEVKRHDDVKREATESLIILKFESEKAKVR
jgi:HEAT repeat protein